MLSHHRVTPEELTRALAKIEARKQEALRNEEAARESKQAYLSATIPVEEAVRELNLEVSPDEIWAEVQEQRAADTHTETIPAAVEPEAVEEGVSLYHVPELKNPPAFVVRRPHRWTGRQSAVTGLILAVLGFTALSSQLHRSLHSTVPLGQAVQAAPSQFNVAGFPNGIPFELTGEDLDRLLHGEDAAKVGVDPNNNYDPNVSYGWWSLVKYDDHVYVRGYVPAPPSKEQFPHRVVEIDNAIVPEDGNRPAEVTLRLDTLKFCSFYDHITVLSTPGYFSFYGGVMDEKIAVSDVHLDQHAWERAGAVMSTEEPMLSEMSTSSKPSAPQFYSPFGEPPLKHLPEKIRPDLKRLRHPNSVSFMTYPDNQPFTIPDQDLGYVLTKTPPSALYISTNQNNLSNPAGMGEWPVIKHSGQFYLRGWVPSDTTKESLKNTQKDSTHQFLHLYNSPLPAELEGTAKQISLRLGSFEYGPCGRFYSKHWDFTGKGFEDDKALFQQQIPLSHVYIDSHAWEKW